MPNRLRKRYSAGEKLKILRLIREARDQGTSIRACCRQLGLQPKQYREWVRQRPQLLAAKKTKKSLHDGRVGLLKELEEQLVEWVLACREVGIPLNQQAVAIKAAELDDDFDSKSNDAQLSIIRRFCAANCIVMRATTHQAQRVIAETEDEALVFIREMRPVFQEMNRQELMIINMDQTPLYYSMTPKKTLNLQGAKTVYSASTMSSTKRITFAAAITASGEKLKPFLIFKGEPHGRIATREFTQSPYRQSLSLHCQKKAWMDLEAMMKWIDLILVPFLQQRGDAVRPLLMLDDYKVHKCDAVRERLEALGVDLQVIPSGCTSLAQPVDVGVAKPIKSRFRKHWLDWVVEKGIDVTFHEEPDRELMQGWVHDMWQEFPQEIARNAWRKTGFSYFPPQVAVEQVEGMDGAQEV